jgi:uncharacterized phage protein gp47/JayE
MQYGLTDAGFVAKTLSVILNEERIAFQTTFGVDIDISDESIAGAYIGNQAAKQAQLWEQLDRLWNAGDRDSSSGSALDRLVALVNVQREAAIATQVTACLWGKENTPAPANVLAKLSTTSDIFMLAREVTISKDNLIGIVIKISELTAGAAYSFKLKNSVISVTATTNDTKETLRDKMSEAIEAALPGLFTTEAQGEDSLKIHITDGVTAFAAVENDDKLETPLLGAEANFTAQETGSIYVPIGTLSIMVSNVSGVDSIYNYATGITGRAAESDTELRLNLGTRQKQATCTETAIQNILETLAGVSYVKVYSNRNILLDGERPPKSYEAVIFGGSDETIAETIFANGPAGVQAYGNTEITVKDSEGYDWVIGFSRPVSRYIWIKISVTLYSEEEFPVNGLDVIKDSIISWGTKNLGVAVDLIYQRLNTPIYQVAGIATAEIKVAVSTAPDTAPADEDFHAANIPIGDVEIAVLDKGRISAEALVQ